MGATSTATFVKKSVGWSIALSVLMIVAGILAIASPLAAGVAVNIFVAWLLVFSGAVHLVFAWYRPSTGGSSGSCWSEFSTFSSEAICSCIRWLAWRR